MKELITHLNKAFDHRVRLGIMSVLVIHEWVEFNSLKEWLELTDGNLASHISALEKEGYLEVRKQFVGKKPQTAYRVTEAGQNAFNDHLDALETILKLRTG